MIRSYYYNSHSDRWIAGHSPHGESREPDLSCVKGIITQIGIQHVLEVTS